MARGRKLYFDILLTGTSASQIVGLTDTGTVPGDRYGAYLDALTALTASSAAAAKQRQEVSALFVPHLGTHSPGTNLPTVPAFFVDFMRNNTLPAIFLTVGGASVPAKQGSTAIFTTHPRVRVQHLAIVNEARAFRGTLYVQRQHSIEV